MKKRSTIQYIYRPHVACATSISILLFDNSTKGKISFSLGKQIVEFVEKISSRADQILQSLQGRIDKKIDILFDCVIDSSYLSLARIADNKLRKISTETFQLSSYRNIVKAKTQRRNIQLREVDVEKPALQSQRIDRVVKIGAIGLGDSGFVEMFSPSITAVTHPFEENSKNLFPKLLSGLLGAVKSTESKTMVLASSLIVNEFSIKKLIVKKIKATKLVAS